MPLSPVLNRLAFAAALSIAAFGARATPKLLVDASTGEVLYARDATVPWYPASLTKLVTVYTAMRAVRAGRLTLDTPLVVSARAARMAPSKMGFRPGTVLTLRNALQMMVTKSANDLAVTVAEGVDGSVETFAADMNVTAAKLGMTQSHFVNPNGLPSADHYSSARDMALVAIALRRDFPRESRIFSVGELALGPRRIKTYNQLLGRFDGADGMKTGFTCAAGFNIVASATRGGRTLIAVVMGRATAPGRTGAAARLLAGGFDGQYWGRGSVASLRPEGGSPPDMRGVACVRHARRADWASEVEDPAAASAAIMAAVRQRPELAPVLMHAAMSSGGIAPPPVFDPKPVYLGPAPGSSLKPLGPRRVDASAFEKARPAAMDATLLAGTPSAGPPLVSEAAGPPLELPGAAAK
ncbi:MAG: D-alanyl-D-alanine carboxypeptidase [Hyphomicrobiales bacterium]|nr:D-alanyl-D-alanine carboxypeptidase [Hyphomicrobiales bacterium]